MDNAEVIAALSDILVEVVANGGSVSFMHPLARDVAADLWKDSLARAGSGRRVVLGAWVGDDLIGTVTLNLATPPNQPHRAAIAKLMTRVSRCGRCVARSLMLEAERIAVGRGRTLLVLDTATEGGAAGLYEAPRLSPRRRHPRLRPEAHGGLCVTIIYFKPIGPAA